MAKPEAKKMKRKGKGNLKIYFNKILKEQKKKEKD